MNIVIWITLCVCNFWLMKICKEISAYQKSYRQTISELEEQSQVLK